MTWLVFFPSITFSIVSAEIFPWALLYVLIHERRLYARLLPFITMLVLSLLLVTVLQNGKYLSESVRSLFAYLNPLLIFFTILRARDASIHELKKLVLYVFPFLSVLGVLQFSSILVSLDPIFKILVPRASSDVLSTARGVTLLSSEPSRAAVEYLFLYAVWRSLNVVSNVKLLIIDILVAIFVIGVVRSALGGFFLILLYGFYYGWKILIPSILVVPFLAIFFNESRAVAVLTALLSSTSIEDSYRYLLNASGFRLISVLSSYADALSTVIGNGIGTWEVSSVKAMTALGFDAREISYFRYISESQFTGVRPTSYMANIALDFGLAGMGITAALLVAPLRVMYSRSRDLRPILAIFMFSICAVGTVGNPVPWICIAICYRCKALNESFVSHALPNCSTSEAVSLGRSNI